MDSVSIKKERGEKAPNRLLDLGDLETPFFRDVLRKLGRLLEEEPELYLHPSKRWEYPWALERAKLDPGSRVLDAGCGASVFPHYLANEGHRVSALDYDAPPPPSRARAGHPAPLRGDLTALPFAPECFDAVFCVSVLEHLQTEGIKQSLMELRRVLVPGGKLLVTTDFFEDAKTPIWYEGPDGSFPVDWQVFDRKRLEMLLKAPGFRADGEIDLTVDWETTLPLMRGFHGYPYTSVGIALVRT